MPTKLQRPSQGENSYPIRLIVNIGPDLPPLKDFDFKDLLALTEIPKKQFLYRGIPPDLLNIPAMPVLYTCSSSLPQLQERARIINPDYEPPSFEGYISFEFDPRVFDTKYGTRTEAEYYLRQGLKYFAGRPGKVVSFYIQSPPIDMDDIECSSPRPDSQDYFKPAPTGIDVHHMHSNYGDTGKGSSTDLFCIDLERGWSLQNLDLSAQPIDLISANLSKLDELEHGTAVLGILMAAEGGIEDITGIVPKLSRMGLVSPHRPPYSTIQPAWNEPDAILCALANLSPGDVLLIERQITKPKSADGRFPLELEKLNLDLITLGTKSGIVIVEAAGNGRSNLDEHLSSQDSGAIIVAAGSLANHSQGTTWKKEGYSNWGRRIDCFAWGEDVLTTGLDASCECRSFGCTSAATAIIAGAVLSIQATIRNMREASLRPEALRSLLRSFGTHADPTYPIGTMPDLAAITPFVLNLPKADLGKIIIPKVP